MKKSQQGFAALEAILIVVVLAVIGGAGYYVWHSRQASDKTSSDTGKTKDTTTAGNVSKTPSESFKTYTAKGSKLKMQIPSTWHVTTDSDGFLSFKLNSAGSTVELTVTSMTDESGEGGPFGDKDGKKVLTTAGVQLDRYYYAETINDHASTGLSKGDVVYSYWGGQNPDKYLLAQYKQLKSDTQNNLATVEAALKTVQLL